MIKSRTLLRRPLAHAQLAAVAGGQTVMESFEGGTTTTTTTTSTSKVKVTIDQCKQ
jgi:hypothetical protein